MARLRFLEVQSLLCVIRLLECLSTERVIQVSSLLCFGQDLGFVVVHLLVTLKYFGWLTMSVHICD